MLITKNLQQDNKNEEKYNKYNKDKRGQTRTTTRQQSIQAIAFTRIFILRSSPILNFDLTFTYYTTIISDCKIDLSIDCMTFFF